MVDLTEFPNDTPEDFVTAANEESRSSYDANRVAQALAREREMLVSEPQMLPDAMPLDVSPEVVQADDPPIDRTKLSDFLLEQPELLAENTRTLPEDQKREFHSLVRARAYEPSSGKLDLPLDLLFDAGKTDADIAKYAVKVATGGEGDEDDSVYQALREAGYNDADILGEFVNVESLSKSRVAGEGILRGLAFLGGPGWGAGKLGMWALSKTTLPLYLSQPLGAILGGSSGIIGGSFLEHELYKEYDARLMPSQRKWLEGGRTFGAGSPFMFTPWLVSKEGTDWGAQQLAANLAKMGPPKSSKSQGVLKYLQDASLSSKRAITPQDLSYKELFRAAGGLATEASALASAGVAGGSLSQSGEFARFIGEGAMGVLNPPNLVASFAPRIWRAGKGFVGKEKSQETAMVYLRNFLEKTEGEDTEQYLADIVARLDDDDGDIARILQTTLVPKTNRDGSAVVDDTGAPILEPLWDTDYRTTAQKLGIPIFSKIEKALHAASPVFSSQAAEASKKSLDGLQRYLLLLHAAGIENPNMLPVAAEFQDKLMRGLLEGRLTQAAQRAVTAAERVTLEAGEKGPASTALYNAVKNVLTEARAQEKLLYAEGGIDRKAPIVLDKFIEEYIELARESTGADVPPFVRTWLESHLVSGALPEPSDASVATVQRLREALDKANKQMREYDFKNPGSLDFVESLLEGNSPYVQAETLRELSKLSNQELKDLGYFESDEPIGPFRRIAGLKLTELFADQEVREAQAVVREQSIPTFEMGSATLGSFLDTRSKMLAQMRAAMTGAQPDPNLARILGRLSDAALDDLGLNLPTVPSDIEGPLQRSQLALRTAHNFSRALNNVFTRAYAANLLRSGRGNRPDPPEVAGDTLMRGGADAVASRISQLGAAAEFMTTYGQPNANLAQIVDTTDSPLGTVRDAQEKILRVMANRLIDPETGQLRSTRELSKYLRDFEPVLKLFPRLQEDLDNARYTANQLKLRAQKNKEVEKRLEAQQIWKRIVGADNVGSVIHGIVGVPGNRSKTVNADIRRLFNYVSKNYSDVTSEELKAGLRDLLYEQAFIHAGGTNARKDFSFEEYSAYLFGRDSGLKKPLIELMREHELIPADEAVRVHKVLDMAEQLEEVAGTLGTVNPKDILNTWDMLKKGNISAALSTGLIRIMGSKGGTQIGDVLEPIMGRGQGLVEAGVGANIATQIMSGTGEIIDPAAFLLLAFRDPKFFKVLAGQPKTELQALKQGRSIWRSLKAAGLIAADEVFIEPFHQYSTNPELRERAKEVYGNGEPAEEPAPVSTERVDVKPLSRPLTMLPRVSFPQQTVAARPPAPAPAPAPASPEQRSRFAAMFPGDITSGLIRQQDVNRGIGSLA